MSAPLGAPSRLAVLATGALAMIGFAANSILCRLALRFDRIDPAGFTAVRLASGTIALWGLVFLFGRSSRGSRRAGGSRLSGGSRRSSRAAASPSGSSWISGLLLFAYAFAFSLAYRSLSVGTGALILFGAVQVTMIAAGLLSGERPHWLQWVGLAAATAGLLYLVSPGISAPRLGGAVLMAIAGHAWGIYSLRGRRNAEPLRATAGNFLRSVPFVLAACVPLASRLRFDLDGIALATASGALASGLGYVSWYAALRGLRAMQAAAVQLSVPVLAAAGGVLLLAERPSVRLLASSAAILGGLGLALWDRVQTTTRPGTGKMKRS